MPGPRMGMWGLRKRKFLIISSYVGQAANLLVLRRKECFKHMMGNSRHRLAALILLAFFSLSCGLAQPIIDRVKSSKTLARLSSDSSEVEATRRRLPTPRPTFTPTPDYTATPTDTPTPTITPIPTETLTPVPTDTPTSTYTPAPTDTPVPTNTNPPPLPTETFTPAPTPTPDYLFKIAEQGNREFQKTTHHTITIYVAALDANNVPIGDLKMVGNHVPSGKHAESLPSDWNWSTANCLNCSYVKQGNLKFEPGPYEDGTWNVYLADGSGNQLSETIPLSYSADPQQWVWDFFILQKK